MMRTSKRGIAQLEKDEGVVLRAYLCPAGIWTIGAGLTAASGVVTPVRGMVISREEASRLLDEALERNYEPAVREAMPGAAQHEFDAGVSFHFNTGAIGRASWVEAWRRRDWRTVERRLRAWNRGGGRVLPGLVTRRRDEFAMLRHGIYTVPALREPPDAPPDGEVARIVPPLSARRDTGRLVEMLERLGYEPAQLADGSISARVVRDFQRAHDLTVDAIIGRATDATLRRLIAASTKGD